MEMSKFLIFSLVYYPEYVGGAELAIHEIGKRIGSKERILHLVTLRGSDPHEVDTIHGITVFRIGWKTNNSLFFRLQKILFPFLAFWKACKLHREHHYSHVWSMMANQAGFAGLFFKLKFKKIRFILTLQEGDPIPSIKRKVFFIYPLFTMIFKKADVVTAISSYLQTFGHGMGAKNVVLLPNGVDLSVFKKEYSEEDKSRLRTKLSLDTQHRILITTSRLVIKNGIESVIKTLPSLPEDIVFVILGSGPRKRNLVELAHSLGISHRVRFVGFVEYEDIPRYFSISDAFIRASLSEGLGNSFLEAMYFGLPTIGTRVGGIPDFLIDGVTGFLCEPENLPSIQDAIERAFASGEDIRQKAKNLVEERYNWDTVSKQFEDICES